MSKKSKLTWSVMLGIICIIIGLIYVTHSAGKLPHFFPGYQAGSTHKHIKHSLAAFVVGILFFIYAWFQTGPKQPK